jgi:hypothetical protein
LIPQCRATCRFRPWTARIAEMLDQQRPLRGIRQKLNQLRMPELRNVLTDLNLQRSGRKSELVDRIAATLEVRAA